MVGTAIILKLGLGKKYRCHINVFVFVLDSRRNSLRLNVGSHDIPLFFPPVVDVPNIPLRVRKTYKGSVRY